MGPSKPVKVFGAAKGKPSKGRQEKKEKKNKTRMSVKTHSCRQIKFFNGDEQCV